ncbi:MAG: histidine phosphatase family protein [Cyanobacteriota bacterium]|nr:histidine phosphatase family protein [Cyanobacteriota bacterium]
MLVQSTPIASNSNRDTDCFASTRSAIATQVILVRHGRSTYNEQGRYQGRCDESVLTQKGLEDAYRTGAFLSQIQKLASSHPIRKIYTSPLQRTRQTTHKIVSAWGHSRQRLTSVQVSQHLEEVDMSSWEGLTYQYVRENFPREYRCWQERPDEFETPTGTKPVVELYRRAETFWQEILPRHQGETVVVVAHGGTNRALMATALGMGIDRYHNLQQCNCGVSVLQFPGDTSQLARIRALNLTTHLGKNLPKLKNGKSGLRLLLLPAQTSHWQVRQISRLLSPQSPDVVLSTDLNRSTQLAESFLETHPSTVHLPVLRDDIVWNWAQVIKSRPQPGKSQKPTLVTGLAIAPQATISTYLQKLCGSSSISSEPGTIGVLHFPEGRSHPVVQGLIPI